MKKIIRQLRTFLSQEGAYSMVELMVSIGISGIVVIYGAYLFSNSSKMSQKMEMSISKKQLSIYLTRMLKHNFNCSASLQDVFSSRTPSQFTDQIGGGFSLTSFQRSASATDILSIGGRFGEFIITDIVLGSPTGVSGLERLESTLNTGNVEIYRGILRIFGKFKQDHNQKILLTENSIYLEYDGGFLDCSYGQSSQIFKAKICESLGANASMNASGNCSIGGSTIGDQINAW